MIKAKKTGRKKKKAEMERFLLTGLKLRNMTQREWAQSVTRPFENIFLSLPLLFISELNKTKLSYICSHYNYKMFLYFM